MNATHQTGPEPEDGFDVEGHEQWDTRVTASEARYDTDTDDDDDDDAHQHDVDDGMFDDRRRHTPSDGADSGKLGPAERPDDAQRPASPSLATGPSSKDLERLNRARAKILETEDIASWVDALALADLPIITLVGAQGVGKTSLKRAVLLAGKDEGRGRLDHDKDGCDWLGKDIHAVVCRISTEPMSVVGRGTSDRVRGLAHGEPLDTRKPAAGLQDVKQWSGLVADLLVPLAGYAAATPPRWLKDEVEGTTKHIVARVVRRTGSEERFLLIDLPGELGADRDGNLAPYRKTLINRLAPHTAGWVFVDPIIHWVPGWEDVQSSGQEIMHDRGATTTLYEFAETVLGTANLRAHRHVLGWTDALAEFVGATGIGGSLNGLVSAAPVLFVLSKADFLRSGAPWTFPGATKGGELESFEALLGDMHQARADVERLDRLVNGKLPSWYGIATRLDLVSGLATSIPSNDPSRGFGVERVRHWMQAVATLDARVGR